MKKSEIKSANPKEKILEAAITIFAKNGFDAARTRDIAALAQTNISTLHYHFKSKDNIYKSVIKHINDTANKYMMPTMIAQQEIIAASSDKKEIIAAIKIMALTFVETITAPENERITKIVACEQIDQSKHFKILFENVMKRVCDPFMLAVSKIIDKKITSIEVILLTHTLHGILTSFQTSKSSLIHISGWRDYNKTNIGHIKKHISATIEKLFFNYL